MGQFYQHGHICARNALTSHALHLIYVIARFKSAAVVTMTRLDDRFYGKTVIQYGGD
jgi:hypothetical protein